MIHLLHVSPSFAPGGAQVRTVAIINYLGPSFRHTLVSMDGRFDAAQRIHSGISVTCLSGPPHRTPLRTVPWFLTLFLEERPALILTYNWGSIEAAMAVRLWRGCPLIHTEDGFGPDEATRQKIRRVLFRRAALGSAACVIAPSHTLWRMMRAQWRLDEGRLNYVPNGVDTERFLPGEMRSGRREFVVGSVGHLRPEKKYHVLIEACAALAHTRPVRLLLSGDGPERPMLERVARSLEFQNQVHFLGYQQDVRSVYHQLDVFALSSATEQMPLSVLEAMASGLPVVSADVGDIAEMVSEENRRYICDAASLTAALDSLADDAPTRRRIGAANRARAVSAYSLQNMCAAYESLYCSLLKPCASVSSCS